MFSERVLSRVAPPIRERLVSYGAVEADSSFPEDESSFISMASHHSGVIASESPAYEISGSFDLEEKPSIRRTPSLDDLYMEPHRYAMPDNRSSTPIQGPNAPSSPAPHNEPPPRTQSPTFSTFSFPSPSQLPRAWSPPPNSGLEASAAQGFTGNSYLGNYAERRRGLLDVLNDLHSTGVQSELDLPQIVVVGSQSVGKSSLIESMADITLPRDAGTCTRCPTECRLQYASTWSCTIVLRFLVDSTGRPLNEMREVPFGPTLYNKREVEQVLRRAQRAILRPTLDASVFLDDSDLNVPGHPALTFSANCVCIRVAGPEVPDLYFYDLPGIIANVADGGDEGDIRLVEKLAESYISRPNCIVLLVISCETDFENQGAGRLVLKNDELRNRTVGVLTKVDRIEPGAASKWIKIVRNEEIPLPNGWFCVKQPDLLQLQAGISRQDAKDSEIYFFRSTAPWAGLDFHDRARMGSQALAEHLGTTLAELVSRKLPQILAEIMRQLQLVNAELLEIPAHRCEDPRREVLILLRDFTKKVSKHVDGLPPPASNDPLDPASQGLIQAINDASERFRVKVHQTAPQFRPWNSNATIGAQQRNSMLATVRVDDADGTAVGPVFHLDEIMDIAKRSRTRELPGNYPFAVKENLIVASVKLWRALAKECFKEVQTIVSDHMSRLIREHFASYTHGGLMAAVEAVADEQIRHFIKIAEEKVESLCLSEDKPYTQNEHYFFSYQGNLLARYKSIHRESCGQQALASVLHSYNPSTRVPANHQWQYVNNAISALASLGIHGIAPNDLIKLVPDETAIDSALKIMAEVRAYFQVAYKRFADNIPKQIDTAFVRGIDTGLDLDLMSLELSAERCLEWLRESPAVVSRRNELIGKQSRLENAKMKLGPALRI